MTETFKYDALDRLDTVLFNNSVSRMAYDAYGRMLAKTSGGSVVFSNASYNDHSRPHALRDATVNTDLLPAVEEAQLAYTMFDKVKRVELGNDVLAIDYGYDRQRIGMTETIQANLGYVSKAYVGSCEYIHDLDRNHRLTYIAGPMGVFAVYEELGPLYKGGGDPGSDDAEGDDTDGGYTGALYYLHRDHLGSVTTVTDATGAIVQELSYDAWGNLRNPYTWTGSFAGTPKFDRGFTGHEHHRYFGLINMNGRMYDPVTSSFLSVDSYVQDPSDPQNFNRYAYCLNNPLRYVDPDGELFWVIPNIGYSKDGGLSLGITFAVGLPGLWSAQASVGYSLDSRSVYSSAGVTYAGITGYVSRGYSFKNEQAFASIGITAGLSPYSGVPFSTNFLTVGASCDFTYTKENVVNISFTGNLSAWSYNTASKSWNFNPNVSVMVFPERTTNLVRGQGFLTNDKVLQRFVANEQHQQALDYFGIKGMYRLEKRKGAEYVEGNDFGASTNPTTGEISFGDLAFSSYDNLRGIYEKELYTSNKVLNNIPLETTDIEELACCKYFPEEALGFLHAFYNNGLYPHSTFDFYGQANYYWFSVYSVGIRNHRFYDFIYKIPRKW